jgi:hypothetical protein
MSVSFAPVRSPDRLVTSRLLQPGLLPAPANDDDDDRVDVRTLEAALRHFALHGMGAASTACAEAESHWQEGNRQAAETWLAICGAFDKRSARQLEARLNASANA